jgi:hypothetical protein
VTKKRGNPGWGKPDLNAARNNGLRGNSLPTATIIMTAIIIRIGSKRPAENEGSAS